MTASAATGSPSSPPAPPSGPASGPASGGSARNNSNDPHSSIEDCDDDDTELG